MRVCARARVFLCIHACKYIHIYIYHAPRCAYVLGGLNGLLIPLFAARPVAVAVRAPLHAFVGTRCGHTMRWALFLGGGHNAYGMRIVEYDVAKKFVCLRLLWPGTVHVLLRARCTLEEFVASPLMMQELQ